MKGKETDISQEWETGLSTPTLGYPWRSLLKEWASKKENASSFMNSKFLENGTVCRGVWPYVPGGPASLFAKGVAIH